MLYFDFDRFEITVVMGFEPAGDWENVQHEQLLHLHPALDGKMAALAKGCQVPIRAVGLITVQVVDRKNVAAIPIVGMATAFALVAGMDFDAFSDLLPVWRVSVHAIWAILRVRSLSSPLIFK